MADTQKRQRDMVKKLEEEANKKAKKQFDQQRQNMQKMLEEMKTENKELLDQNVINEARIESLAEQANNYMNANKEYDIQFPELIQENEKLKLEIEVRNRANDKLIAALNNAVLNNTEDADYEELSAKFEKLKATYLKTAQANQLLKGKHEKLTKKHNKLVADYQRLLKVSKQLEERINQTGATKELEKLRQLRL